MDVRHCHPKSQRPVRARTLSLPMTCILVLIFVMGCLERICTALAPVVRYPTLSVRRSSIPHALHMAHIQVTTPSSDAAAEMGIREWPQQLKTGSWEEFVAEDKSVTRYILDGSGSLVIVDEDAGETKRQALQPGTLVEVQGTATLSWTATQDMIILTPGFEEGKLLVIVGTMVFVLFGALLAGLPF